VARRLFLTFVVVGLFQATAPAQQPEVPLETQIKAAFVYQFSRYVDWPPGALPAASPAPFRVCVVADPAFTQTLDRILAGETAAGRPITRTNPDTTDDARQCQILFIGRTDWDRGPGLLAAVQSAPVLTVSDEPDALARGAQILLVRDDNRVRFDVNLAAVRQSGITLRSSLLRLARRLVPGPPRE
jgi:hypothetical protein